jgi:DHA2 family multidrug resistance protein
MDNQISGQTEQPWKPAANPWLIAAGVMLATFMEVLDTSVANVSLTHIAGSLSVSNDEATWVLTSYLVSNAVILPTSSWFSRRFGRRRFLITCITIFTLASLLCGLASSLGFLILARIIQGAGGGALQPVSQAVMLETFPPEKRGAAMAVYAMGVIVAPILGPTLGGWLTDDYSWRWVFYINIPVGIAAILMCLRFLEDPPYLKNAQAGKFDSLGVGFLALWIGCLQVMLDKGQDDDWFSSNYAAALARCSIGSRCADTGLRRFEPDSSTAGGPIGLHGQFPPPGTDLSRVSAYHLPVQESQGTGAS